MYLPTQSASPRRGLSLLEVLVALAIFLLSFVVIGRLTTLASERALNVEYQSQATRLAQSKLNEVIGGFVSLQGGSGDFDGDDSDWHWNVDATQNGDVANLWTVTVTVTRPYGNEGEISSSLTQMVLDPSVRGSVFDQWAVTGAGDTAPSGQNATGSGSNSGGAGMSGGMGGGMGGGGAGRGRGGRSGGGMTGGIGGGGGTGAVGGRGAGGTGVGGSTGIGGGVGGRTGGGTGIGGRTGGGGAGGAVGRGG